MDSTTINRLKQWFPTTPESRLEYDDLGVKTLLYLVDEKIDWDFLHAAAKFWDTKLHTFRFGAQEMCPIPHEFGALAGWSSELPFLRPVINDGYVKDFEKILDIPYSEARKLLCGGFFHVKNVIDTFIDVGDLTDNQLQKRRKKALCLCLIQHLLFVNPPGQIGKGYACLIHVVENMWESAVSKTSKRATPMEMVVAETILGLDDVQCSSNGQFRGSPLLLQMWLMERLKLVEPPGRNYFPYRFPLRKKMYEDKTTEEWMTIITERVALWVVPHWKVYMKDMMYHTSLGEVVELMGIESITYFIPSRIMRQYGLKQIPVKDPFIDPNENKRKRRVTKSKMNSCERSCKQRTYISIHWEADHASELSESVKLWMMANTKEEREVLLDRYNEEI